MPASAPTKPGRTCPNCSAFVPAGRISCMSCHLAVSKMDGFLAAKNAAKTRGFSGKVDTGERPFFLKTGFFIKVACLLIVAGAVYYFFLIPKPPRYLTFPGTPQASAQAFLKDISGGDDKNFDQAYALVPDSVRNPKNSDEHGDYLQIFDAMNNYFTSEFGDDWLTQTTFSADPADPNTIIAQVALQTLHIHTANQSQAGTSEQPHFGITGMDEFDVAWAPSLRQGEGINGALHMLTGSEDAGNMIQKVTGSFESNRSGPPMVKKIRILKAIHNPHATIWRDVVQALPFRKDPVVHARLVAITQDQRYDSQTRDMAQQVIDNKVDEAIRIDANLPDAPGN